MSDTPQSLRWAQYEQVTVTVTMSPATSISGWTLAFTVRNSDGTLMVSKTTASGITITDAGAGIFTIALATADTGAIPPGVYDFDVWRTNSGNETRLAYGPLVVDKQVRQ